MLASACLTGTLAAAQIEHFHPKGKAPSEHTKRVLEEARKSLPFDDDRDFAESDRGFIAVQNGPAI